ncbi:hypothetical protein C8Q79DRAFT_978076 [Trametes meyenii]|nr:hypothetical protein C8Q79DRAFT_978076 [Trametes meyenii]
MPSLKPRVANSGSVPTFGTGTGLLSLIPALERKCYYCGKAGAEDRKLRRCAKCNVALYCSRECQKNAWPKHKILCAAPNTRNGGPVSCIGVQSAPSSISIQPSGVMAVHATSRVEYTDATDAGRSIRKFVETQDWAIRIMIQASIYLSMVDVTPIDRQGNVPEPRVAFFQVAPVVGERVTPANLWKIVNCSALPVREAGPDIERRIWEGKPGEGNPRNESSNSTPTSVMAPVIFAINDVLPHNIVITHFRIPLPHWPPIAYPQSAKDALEDLVTFCSDQINQGLCLRQLSEDNYVAVPNRMVRSGGEWKWERTVPDDWAQRPLQSIRSMIPWRTQLTPAKLVLILTTV